MLRILLVQPDEGLAQLIRGVLSDSYQIDILNYFPSDAEPPSSQIYEAVLCRIDDPQRAIEAFDQLSEISPKALLVPIVATSAELEVFVQRWNSEPWRKEKCPNIGEVWLSKRCTAGQILGLLRKDDGAKVPSLGSGGILDGYRLISVIGQGGFGTSWLAVSEATGRRVAIKIIEQAEALGQELAALRKYIHVAYVNEHLLRPDHVNCNASRLWIVNSLADSITGGDTPDAYRPLSLANVGSSRVDLQACKLEYSIVSPK